MSFGTGQALQTSDRNGLTCGNSHQNPDLGTYRAGSSAQGGLTEPEVPRPEAPTFVCIVSLGIYAVTPNHPTSWERCP